MILIDKVGHLVSDKSLDELHKFARSIGLRRDWFQDKRIPHYDCTTNTMRWKAFNNGAEYVSSKEIVRKAVTA